MGTPSGVNERSGLSLRSAWSGAVRRCRLGSPRSLRSLRSVTGKLPLASAGRSSVDTRLDQALCAVIGTGAAAAAASTSISTSNSPLSPTSEGSSARCCRRFSSSSSSRSSSDNASVGARPLTIGGKGGAAISSGAAPSGGFAARPPPCSPREPAGCERTTTPATTGPPRGGRGGPGATQRTWPVAVAHQGWW